ncbi:MAG: sulfite exporter TauE/SafE family protein [Bacteroidales bacterium]|nr:sulfite exporter TauE/SafE family protein [Bacteroidales bacterium]
MILLSEIIDTGIPLFTGFLMSVVHVVSGPDHLAAVTPLAIDSKKKSWSIGLSWGIGHTLGMLLIGMIFIFFKEHFDVEKLSEYGEQSVGFLLIGIGVWVLIRLKSKRNIHEHKISEKDLRQNISGAGVIGVIHGVAGFSHILFLLPVLGFSTNFGSAMYLVGFTIGTLFSMISYSVILGFATYKTDATKSKSLSVSIRFIGAFFSIAIGFFWIWESIFN